MGYAARPSSSFGYWRGGMSDGPFYLGQGSGQGPVSQGAGILPPGSGAAGPGGWTPTLTFLLVLVAVELVLFKFLERRLR